jgi:WD40 repeat protein
VSDSIAKAIHLWDLMQRKVIAVFRGHQGNASVAFAPDGTYLVSGGGDSTLLVWDLKRLAKK